MTNHDYTDGVMVTGGFTLPWWIQALEGWLQVAVIILSIILLLYTIRARRLEIKARQAQIATSPVVEHGTE